ncbi:MAG: DUF922 domain-containing protein, partial [Pseudomonadales bacterium]
MAVKQNFQIINRAMVCCVRLAFLGLLVGQASVHAEPVVNESVEYYDVDADTLGTLLLELESKVPLRPAGNVYHGYTSSQVFWRWRHAQRGQRCRMMQVSSEANIAMTLPRLRRTRPGSEVERVWAR